MIKAASEQVIGVHGGMTANRRWIGTVRIAARVLLVFVFLLSCVRVVRVGRPENDENGETVLLIVTHSRAAYLERCMRSVVDTHGGAGGWRILVSRDRHDGAHADVDAVIEGAERESRVRGIDMEVVTREDTDVEDDEVKENELVDEVAYRRIASHYRFALGAAFGQGAARVVVLEDDMEVASDFYDYFDALAPLLEKDRTLWCVSAWNDNGKALLSRNASQLYRTDFFPGLGWMLTRSVWEELEPQWPAAFWDDWMRDPAVTAGRQCVRPEVARVRNFGQHGASTAFHYREHVAQVVMASGHVDFASLDMSYLEAARFEQLVFTRMRNAVRLKYSNYLTSRPQDEDVIAFFPKDRPAVIGRRTGIMTDHRHGVFRTSYRGVIIVPWRAHWAFLVPNGYTPPAGYTLGKRECCD